MIHGTQCAVETLEALRHGPAIVVSSRAAQCGEGARMWEALKARLHDSGRQAGLSTIETLAACSR